MVKKTVALVSLAVAATAGAAFFTESPASAETVHTAQATAAGVQTTSASTPDYPADFRGHGWGHSGWGQGDRWGHGYGDSWGYRHAGYRHWGYRW